MRWRIAILSSGEVSLVARIAEGARNNRARAGQEVRIIDLQADAGRGYGIFDHPGPTGDPGELANVIRDATQANYGVAGPAFVEVLLKHRAKTVAGVRGIIAAFKANHVPSGANGQIGRVAERFALAAAAGEIAIGAKILPFAPGAVLEAAEGLFKGWIAARGGVGASESRAAVDAMRQFIQAHGKSRFIRMDDEDVENQSFRVMNAAGHYSRSKGLFYLNDFGWLEAMAGLDRTVAINALFAAGYLKKDKEGKSKPPTYIDGEQRRVYRISAEILEGDEHV
jgi:putative DNA primase/helicase